MSRLKIFRLTADVRAAGCGLLAALLLLGTGGSPDLVDPDTPAKRQEETRPYADLLAKPYAYHGPGSAHRQSLATDDVRIGFFGPLADTGVRQGADLAVTEANAEGGWRGARPFRLVCRSSARTWGSAKEVVKLAYEDQVWAVLGSVGGQTTHVAEQIVTKARLVLLSPASTDVSLTRVNIPWMFRCMPDDDRMAAALADQVFKEGATLKVAAIAEDTYDSRQRLAAFEKAARRRGHPLTLSIRYDPKRTNTAKTLRLIHRSQVWALVIWGGPQMAARLMRGMRDQGMTQAVFGGPHLASRQFITLATDCADGVTAVAPCNMWRNDPHLQRFIRSFEARYGEPPDAVAAYGYDSMQLLVRAVREAGLDRVKVREELAGIEVFHGVTGTLHFDGSGSNVTPPVLLKMRDGRFTPFLNDDS